MKKDLLIKTLTVGQMQTNCYIVCDQNSLEAAVIDPGDDAEYIHASLRDLHAKPTQIIATHGHFDHILAALEIRLAYTIPFRIHESDTFLVSGMKESARHFLGIHIEDMPPKIDGFIKEGDQIQIGRHDLRVIETPGHTPGSICLHSRESSFILTGDTIFAGGSVGRTDFSYSSSDALLISIQKILKYSEDPVLYPGHGPVSSIKQEKQFHL